MVKAVLEAIPVYWISFSWIPEGILEEPRRTYFRFLWSGKKETQVNPWVHWEKIVVPKGLGGWGINIFLFAKSLAAKVGWIPLKFENIWTQVISHKYIAPNFVEDWIRNPRKFHA